MNRAEIPFTDLVLPVMHTFDKQWMLLAAGDFAARDFNCMTVSWGSLGVIWNKPFAMVVVRPTRHTWGFMERFDSFTLSVFPEAHRDRLSWLGSKSGRDVDKINGSGLSPASSRKVASPGFEEAELVIECRKRYFDDLEPRHFLDPSIESNYPKKDYHRMYFGEIVAIEGAAAWRKE
jgi:flavin reductase (DIM6/NTAB) family NADH-FMN oxidoreductase RutF